MAQSIFITTAKKFEPKIRKALIKAWNQLRTQESMADIERALQSGGIEAVMDMFDDMGIVINKAVSESIDAAIKAGADLTAIVIPAPAILNKDAVFDLFNPYTADYINRYKLNLVQGITSNTREAMRNELAQDIVAGVNPKTTARNFKNTIGLTPNQQQAVRNYRGYLENLDRQALQRELRDKRFDPTVLRAIEEGKPLTTAQIDKMVNRYREKYIKYRAEVIARTESLRAVSIGNDLNIRQMILDGDIDLESVRKVWHYVGGPRTRDAHLKVPGLNPGGVMLDRPFVTPLGPLMFPRDPNGTAANTVQCRCWLTYKLI